VFFDYNWAFQAIVSSLETFKWEEYVLSYGQVRLLLCSIDGRILIEFPLI
jgi:hypothetical protein